MEPAMPHVVNALASEAGEQALVALFSEWLKSVTARDLSRIENGYAPDVVYFDATPPFQHRGFAEYRKAWENCFPYLPERFEFEHREMAVTVSGDLAVRHGFARLLDSETKHPATCGWVRVTVCYRRDPDGWRVFHEHVSVPFDPLSSQAAFIREL